MMWISKITRLSRTTFIHHELSSTNGIRISVWIRTPYHHHPTKRKYEQNFKMQSHKKYNSHVEFQMQAKNIQVYELIIILLGTDEVNKRGLFSLSFKKKKERNNKAYYWFHKTNECSKIRCCNQLKGNWGWKSELPPQQAYVNHQHYPSSFYIGHGQMS